MDRENREIEVDLLQLCKAILAKAKYILLVTVIFGMCGFAGSKMFLEPVYEATVKMSVITQTQAEDVINDRLNSAKSLVDTYAIVIKNRAFMDKIIKELDLDMTPGQLASCISVKSVNKTEIMQVAVRHTDRTLVKAIALKIDEHAAQHINDEYPVGTVKIVEHAYAKEAPVSPNHKSNAVLAALVGFALSCGLFAVLHLMDNTYKSKMDIQNDLDMPVLGVIPKVECCGKYSRYGYKYGYGYGYGQPAHRGKFAKKGGKFAQTGKFVQKEK